MNFPEERKLQFLHPIMVEESHQLIKAKSLVISLLFLQAILFLLSLYQRAFFVDEATLGEQVYWLMEEGTVKSLLYKGTGTGLSEELLIYHKLYIWLATGLSYLFGLHLPLLRSISLFFSCLLCFSLYRYCKDYLHFEQSRLRLFFMLLVLLLFSHSLYFTFSFLFRPELMQTWLGFMSFYMLTAYLKKDKIHYLSLAGTFAGLSALTHLNGLIYIGAGALLLLYKRKMIALGIFTGLSALVSAFYFIDMLEPGAFDRAITQFAGAPAFKKSDLHPLNRIWRVLSEHKRYFHSSTEVSFSLLFILLLGARFKYMWQRYSNLMLYTLFAALCLAVLNQGQTTKYALLLLPFACLIMALAFMDILQRQPKYVLHFSAAFLIYFSIQLYDITELIEQRIDLPARNTSISQHIPKGSRVFAPASFFYNEYEDYEILSYQGYYTLVDRFHRLDYNRKDFFAHARSINCEYIIVDLFFFIDVAREGIRPEFFRPGNTFLGYKVMKAENNYIVLKDTKGQ
jgi:hypothetical protein